MYPSRRGNSLRGQRSSAGREGERQSHRPGGCSTLPGTASAPAAFLLLSLPVPTAWRHHHSLAAWPGRAGWGCGTLQGHCWKRCGQEYSWALPGNPLLGFVNLQTSAALATAPVPSKPVEMSRGTPGMPGRGATEPDSCISKLIPVTFAPKNCLCRTAEPGLEAGSPGHGGISVTRGSLPRWRVKAAHCLALAVKAPPSTDRYRVLTVWERRRLNRDTLEPEEMQTVGRGGWVSARQD